MFRPDCEIKAGGQGIVIRKDDFSILEKNNFTPSLVRHTKDIVILPPQKVKGLITECYCVYQTLFINLPPSQGRVLTFSKIVGFT